MAIEPSEHVRILDDGRLMIQNVTRSDAGKFLCVAENFMGSDSITHELSVLGEKGDSLIVPFSNR